MAGRSYAGRGKGEKQDILRRSQVRLYVTRHTSQCCMHPIRYSKAAAYNVQYVRYKATPVTITFLHMRFLLVLYPPILPLLLDSLFPPPAWSTWWVCMISGCPGELVQVCGWNQCRFAPELREIHMCHLLHYPEGGDFSPLSPVSRISLKLWIIVRLVAKFLKTLHGWCLYC